MIFYVRGEYLDVNVDMLNFIYFIILELNRVMFICICIYIVIYIFIYIVIYIVVVELW